MSKKNPEKIINDDEKMMNDDEKISYVESRAERSRMESYIGNMASFDSFKRVGQTGDYKLTFDTELKHVIVHFNPVTREIKVKEYTV